MAKGYVDDTAVVEDGAAIGDGSKIWHFCHILPNTKIGRRLCAWAKRHGRPQCEHRQRL